MLSAFVWFLSKAAIAAHVSFKLAIALALPEFALRISPTAVNTRKTNASSDSSFLLLIYPLGLEPRRFRLDIFERPVELRCTHPKLFRLFLHLLDARANLGKLVNDLFARGRLGNHCHRIASVVASLSVRRIDLRVP